MAYFNAVTKAGSLGSASADAKKAYLTARGKYTDADNAGGRAVKAKKAADEAKTKADGVFKAAVALQKSRAAHYSGITGKASAKAAKDKKDHAALVLAATGLRDSAKTSAQKAATAASDAVAAAKAAKGVMDNAKTALGKA